MNKKENDLYKQLKGVSEGEFGMPKSYLSLLFFSKALK
jgi:hypothetical protein